MMNRLELNYLYKFKFPDSSIENAENYESCLSSKTHWV